MTTIVPILICPLVDKLTRRDEGRARGLTQLSRIPGFRTKPNYRIVCIHRYNDYGAALEKQGNGSRGFLWYCSACNPNEALWKQFPRQRNRGGEGEKKRATRLIPRGGSCSSTIFRFFLVPPESPVDPLIGIRCHGTGVPSRSLEIKGTTILRRRSPPNIIHVIVNVT